MEVEFEYEGVGRVLGVNADVWMWCGDDAVGFWRRVCGRRPSPREQDSRSVDGTERKTSRNRKIRVRMSRARGGINIDGD